MIIGALYSGFKRILLRRYGYIKSMIFLNITRSATHKPKQKAAKVQKNQSQ